MPDRFVLGQPHIFDRLRYGGGDATHPDTEENCQLWFFTIIAGAYRDIVKQTWGIDTLLLSPERLEEVRIQWLHDIGRIDIDGSREPDEFKLTGFLAYWLRRRCVITNAIRSEASLKAAADIGFVKHQTQFLMRCNEITAFMIGHCICVYWNSDLSSDESAIQDLSDFDIDREFLFDIGTLMKQKNLSPHALYIIYRGIINSRMPPRIRK